MMPACLPIGRPGLIARSATFQNRRIQGMHHQNASSDENEDHEHQDRNQCDLYFHHLKRVLHPSRGHQRRTVSGDRTGFVYHSAPDSTVEMQTTCQSRTCLYFSNLEAQSVDFLIIHLCERRAVFPVSRYSGGSECEFGNGKVKAAPKPHSSDLRNSGPRTPPSV